MAKKRKKLEAQIKRTPTYLIRVVFHNLLKNKSKLSSEDENEIFKIAEEIAAGIYHEQLLEEYPERVFSIFSEVKEKLDELRYLTEILDSDDLREAYGFYKPLQEIDELRKHVNDLQHEFYPVLKDIYKRLKRRRR